MSDTIRKKKKPNHARVNFQMPRQELEALDGIEIDGISATRSMKVRLAVNKFVLQHKRNKKERE